jgi:photosystem II stability/assembly factor-like uncharacterized protein
MRMRHVVSVCMLLLGLSTRISAGERMQLLTSSVGWAENKYGDHIFWTTDGGAQWTDITPPTPPNSSHNMTIVSVFFLDTNTGWVLFSGGDNDNPQFELASTVTAGAAWSIAHLQIPDFFDPERGLSGGGTIFFLDSFHGWTNLGINSNVAFPSGGLLVTVDGGRTWNKTPQDPGYPGFVVFTTIKDGWEVSSQGYELFVTHDGANSWQQVPLAAPKSVSTDYTDYPIYDLPIFKDKLHGFEAVTYPSTEAEGSKLAVVLFATEDGGLTWKPDRVLTNLKGGSQKVASTIADSTWITAAASENTHQATVRKLQASSSVIATATTNILGLGSELSFANPMQGWVWGPDGLLSTEDGGATWTTITPGRTEPLTLAPQSVQPLAPLTLSEGGASEFVEAAPSLSAGVSKHIGFDKHSSKRYLQGQSSVKSNYRANPWETGGVLARICWHGFKSSQ